MSTKNAKSMTTTQLQSLLKRGALLMLAEVDGALWMSTRFFAVRVPDESVIRDLLAEYNLDAEPMCCDVGRTVVRNDAEPPNLADLVNKAGNYSPLTRATYGGKAFVLADVGYDAATGVVFEHPTGKPITLNERYGSSVEKLAGSGATGDACWMGTGLSQIDIARWAEPDGQTLGIAMPIRVEFSFGAALEDAA